MEHEALDVVHRGAAAARAHLELAHLAPQILIRIVRAREPSSQLGQLEMLGESGDRTANHADIVARINRLATLDAALGGAGLARRFEAVRRAALGSTADAADGTAQRRTDGRDADGRAPTRGPANRKD